jgi:hypothetical protein
MRYFLIILILIINGCSNKHEQTIELEFLKLMCSKKLYYNDILLERIQKKVYEEGPRIKDSALFNKAENLIKQRNTYLNNTSEFIALSKRIESIYKKTNEVDTSKLKYTRFYIKKLNEGFDSLVYLRLLNSYLELEEDILEDCLMNLGSSCRFYNSNAHVLKITDTVKLNEDYEFTVIPDYFDYTRIKLDTCEVFVYQNGKRATVPTTILQKGAAFLISIHPHESGTYRVTGCFKQSARNSDFKLNHNFSLEFIVKNGQ